VIFELDDNTELRYKDTRKFGRMHLIKKDELDNCKALVNVGLEPFAENLTSDYLLEKYKTKKLPIKTVLLDQTIISGLGNIYADEVLYASKIHPLRNALDLNEKECERIIESSKRIILKAIEEGGTTIKSYTSSLGVIGNYQNYLKVHTKENALCEVCHEKIQKIKVGGRSTYFCKNCQK